MLNLTELSTLRMLCEKHGFELSKRFGQNFIINAGVCPKICDSAGINKNLNVLEIGPGFGTLTQQLALNAKKVVAIEVDARLLPVLEETLAEYSNVKVVHEDVMKCDLAALIQKEFEGPVLVCANLPYYITSPILMKLLESRLPLESITVMVQKEAAERLVAQLGTRAVGAISYAVHYYAAPSLDFTVKPGSFYPAPKVTSAVIRLVLHKTLALEKYPLREKQLFALIKAAFGQRRKTLANAASAVLKLPKPQIEAAMQKISLPALARPETLTLEDFIRLEAAIWSAPEKTPNIVL